MRSAAAVQACPGRMDSADHAAVETLAAAAIGDLAAPDAPCEQLQQQQPSSLGDTGQDGADAADAPQDTAAAKSTGRRRKPTAAALAAKEEALEGDRSRSSARSRTRKRSSSIDAGSVSRTSHGGVKIGGRAVTWVGGAGMSREVLDRMGIPQLRALFLKTFNHPTGSNNAEWLRKKLAQPVDPQVGAARAAVPRARDCSAEIWTTGTGFKGFTKQERMRLQQMGGNCAAKVVEVIKDAPLDPDLIPDKAPAAVRRRKRPPPATPPVDPDNINVRVVGAETFNLPPDKRGRLNGASAAAAAAAAAVTSGADAPEAEAAAAANVLAAAAAECASPRAATAPVSEDAGDNTGVDVHHDSGVRTPIRNVSTGALLQLCPSSHDLAAASTLSDSYPDLQALQAHLAADSSGTPNAAHVQAAPGLLPGSLPWRTLRREDAGDLRAGCAVKVYRADERWHAGVIEHVRSALIFALC